MTENNGNLAARAPNGTFGPGNTFGGRKLGAKGRWSAQVVDAFGDMSSKAVAVIRQKLDEGDLKAAMFVLNRLLPEGRLIEIASSEPSAWADAMAAGEITPTEASKAAQALKTISDASEVKELRARLDELEQLVAASR